MPGRRKARGSEAVEKTEPRTGRHDGPCFDELAIFPQSFLKGKFKISKDRTLNQRR